MSRSSVVRTATAIGAVAAVVVLAACSSSSGGSGAQAPAAAAPSGGSFGGGANGGGFGPRAAASGEIAQVSGATLQVQSSSAQTAVKYTAKTRFTITKAAGRSAVRVGSCIVAMSSSTGSGSTIKASAVRVSAAHSGMCTGAGGSFGGRPGAGAGGFRSGAPSGVPAGMPSGGPRGARPSGAPGGFGAQRGGFAAGKVTKVSGSAVTVRSSGGGSGATTRTVTLTAATKYTTTVATNHTAAKVGACAVAQGKTASNGTVTATSISLSPKTGGSCTTGFGGPRG